MTLQSSGPISLNDINIELGNASGAEISLNDAAVRSLLEDAAGAISMSSAYGKSAGGGLPQDVSKAVYLGSSGSFSNPSSTRPHATTPSGDYLVPYAYGLLGQPGAYAGFVHIDSTGALNGTFNVISNGESIHTSNVIADGNYIYVIITRSISFFNIMSAVAMYEYNSGNNTYTRLAAKYLTTGNAQYEYGAYNVYDMDSTYIYLTPYGGYTPGLGSRITRNNTSMPLSNWSTSHYPNSYATTSGVSQRFKGHAKKDLTVGTYSYSKYGNAPITTVLCSNQTGGTLEGVPAITNNTFQLGNANDPIPRPILDTDTDGTNGWLVGVGIQKTAANKNNIYFCRIDPTVQGANKHLTAVSNINVFTAGQNLWDHTTTESLRAYMRYLPSLGVYVFAVGGVNTSPGNAQAVVGFYDDTTQTILHWSRVTNSTNTNLVLNYQHQDLGDAINGIAYVPLNANVPLPVFEHSSTVTIPTPNSPFTGSWTYTPLGTPTKTAGSWTYTTTAYTASMAATTGSQILANTSATAIFPATLTDSAPALPSLYTANIS